MLATGKLSPDAISGNLMELDSMYGTEFSGRDSQGKRVMGTNNTLALATTIPLNRELVWQVPDEWTLEEAATVPVAYCTAYIALCIRGRMKCGESILIHGGSGGVGIASIRIALHAGCKVFTTVGSQEKREFLKKIFPELSDR